MSTRGDYSGYDNPAEAENAFYRAFRELSFVAMERVWGTEDIACLHPGGVLLQGRKAVLDSWARILNASAPPHLQYELDLEQAVDDLCVHNVREIIAPSPGESAVTVRSVNAYRRFPGGWLMVLHHATLPIAPAVSGASPGKRSHTLQ